MDVRGHEPTGTRTYRATNIPSHFLTARIKYKPGKCPKALALEIKVLGQYLGVLSAYGDFKWYHDRYNHRDAKEHYPCTSYAHGRQEKGPENMVHCYTLRCTIQTWPPPRSRKGGETERNGRRPAGRCDCTGSTLLAR